MSEWGLNESCGRCGHRLDAEKDLYKAEKEIEAVQTLYEDAAKAGMELGVKYAEVQAELALRLKEAEAREAVMVEALDKIKAHYNYPQEIYKAAHSIATEALSLASPRAKQILAVVEAAQQHELFKICGEGCDVCKTVRALK